MVLVVFTQLGHVADGMRLLSHQGSFSEKLIVTHQVELSTEVIDVGDQLVSGDATERVLEHSIELVTRDILSTSNIGGWVLLPGLLMSIQSGRAWWSLLLLHAGECFISRPNRRQDCVGAVNDTLGRSDRVWGPDGVNYQMHVSSCGMLALHYLSLAHHSRVGSAGRSMVHTWDPSRKEDAPVTNQSCVTGGLDAGWSFHLSTNWKVCDWLLTTLLTAVVGSAMYEAGRPSLTRRSQLSQTWAGWSVALIDLLLIAYCWSYDTTLPGLQASSHPIRSCLLHRSLRKTRQLS